MSEPVNKPVDLVRAKSLMWAGLATDGAHHKQWYLEQIGEALGIDMAWQREANNEMMAANHPDVIRWEPGIRP